MTIVTVYFERLTFYTCVHCCPQMRGPDLMHTVYGEVKGCFQMLSGVAYSAPANSAHIVREYEAKLNKRYSQPQVCHQIPLLALLA